MLSWMVKLIGHLYQKIISVDNLLAAWEEFVVNKKKRADVRVFAKNLLQNVVSLHNDLTNYNYKHASYERFRINDPKPRIIHKACVRDRLLHHAICRQLQPLFDKIFIFDSYSCREGKGTHRAFKRVAQKARQVGRNKLLPCFALKCDIKRYFDNVDHSVLISLLKNRIKDVRLIRLLKEIIESFAMMSGKGMPLGNLTSQLFANVYMDPLDKFVKHRLKVKNYIRYADDFLLLDQDSNKLLGYFVEINNFLKTRLKLSLHPDKISLRKFSQGIDFVGYIALPEYSLPRKSTVKRIFKTMAKEVIIELETIDAKLQSYLGYFKHVSAYKIATKLIMIMGDSGGN